MSRTTFATSALIASLTLLAAGCATSPNQQSLDASKVAANQKSVSQIGCTGDTGSRIQRKEDECRGPGRTYSQEELERTGQFNAADALKRLDPSIQ